MLFFIVQRLELLGSAAMLARHALEVFMQCLCFLAAHVDFFVQLRATSTQLLHALLYLLHTPTQTSCTHQHTSAPLAHF